MFAGTPSDLRSLRDRALLLIGFAGAFRRSELVALRYEDIRFATEGLAVTIPKSKTDPEGEGQTVGIPYGSHPESCPVRALEVWLERSNITYGYLLPRSAISPGISPLVGQAFHDYSRFPQFIPGHSATGTNTPEGRSAVTM